MRIQEPNVLRLPGRTIEAETHGVCAGHRRGGSQLTGGWQLLAATRRGAAYGTPDRASSFRSFPSDVPPRWRFLSEARAKIRIELLTYALTSFGVKTQVVH